MCNSKRELHFDSEQTFPFSIVFLFLLFILEKKHVSVFSHILTCSASFPFDLLTNVPWSHSSRCCLSPPISLQSSQYRDEYSVKFVIESVFKTTFSLLKYCRYIALSRHVRTFVYSFLSHTSNRSLDAGFHSAESHLPGAL